MKTILDYPGFMDIFKEMCKDQKIDILYIQSYDMLATKNRTAYLEGDKGDEVFDAVGATLRKLGIRIGVYDVIDIRTIYDSDDGIPTLDYIGITVKFKEIEVK